MTSVDLRPKIEAESLVRTLQIPSGKLGLECFLKSSDGLLGGPKMSKGREGTKWQDAFQDQCNKWGKVICRSRFIEFSIV